MPLISNESTSTPWFARDSRAVASTEEPSSSRFWMMVITLVPPIEDRKDPESTSCANPSMFLSWPRKRWAAARMAAGSSPTFTIATASTVRVTPFWSWATAVISIARLRRLILNAFWKNGVMNTPWPCTTRCPDSSRDWPSTMVFFDFLPVITSASSGPAFL